MTDESNWSPLITSSGWRFTIRQLLIGTAIIAAGLVVLRNASGAWAAALLAGTQLALATSILLVIFRRGAARAFWLGFAIFGWLYLFLLMFSETLSNDQETPFRPYYMATTRLSNACYHWMFDKAFERYMTQYPARYPYAASSDPFAPGPSQLPPSPQLSPSPWPPPGAPPPPGPDEQSFANVAHALWTLLLALGGGQLAKWLYTTQGRQNTVPPAAG